MSRLTFLAFLLFSTFLRHEKNDLKLVNQTQDCEGRSSLLYPIPDCAIGVQDLRPKGQDVRKEELGYVVDKEMVATSTAIEEAVLRMDVRTRSCTSTPTHPPLHAASWIKLNVFVFLISLRRRS